MTDEELKALFDDLGNQLGGEMRSHTGELRGEVGELRSEMGELRGEMSFSHVELRRHFDEVVEHFDSKYNLVAEGIVNLDEKMDRNHASIREEMRQGFSDTHDLIKYAYNLARQKP